MLITREEAPQIFRKRYGGQDLKIHEITDGKPSGAVFNRPDNVWSITFGTQISALVINEASRIVCVSKISGDIVYDGWCHYG